MLQTTTKKRITLLDESRLQLKMLTIVFHGNNKILYLIYPQHNVLCVELLLPPGRQGAAHLRFTRAEGINLPEQQRTVLPAPVPTQVER